MGEVHSDCEQNPEQHDNPLSPNDVKALVSPENFDTFHEVAKAFADAERRIKLVEWDNGTDIPSINELRYVGYHIFKACQHFGDPKKQYEELKRAERHCIRASYDAIELGLIGQLEKLAAFKNDHKDLIISEVIKDYNDYLHKAAEIQHAISKPIGIEDHRKESYLQFEEYLKTLKDINLKLDSARDELLKKREIHNHADKKDRRNFYIAIFCALVAVITLLTRLDNQTVSSATASTQTQAQPQTNSKH